ncbi:MAG: TlpA family protein disulfide reductase [Bacteroidales bacterium]|nr:TlpA family protein disulfide reductase [Bacteroidales bacterium]
MKKILFLLILFLPVAVFSQCVFSGKIIGYSFGRLYICEQFGDDSKVVETITTNANGEFVFNFTNQQVGLYRIHADNKDYFDIIYSGENIRLETSIRNMKSSMKILESAENQQLYAYVAQAELSEYKIGILRELVKIYPQGEFLTAAEKELGKEKAQVNTCLDKAIKQKNGTFASRYLSYFREINFNISESTDKKMNFLSRNFPMNDLELLNSNAYHHFIVSYLKKYEPSEYLNAVREILDYLKQGNQEIFSKMFDYVLTGFESMERYDDLYQLSVEYGNSCSTDGNLKTRVKSYTDLRVGAKAPDFEIVTIDGEDVVLSQMKNDYTLVIFWATWCENCKEEIPRINEAISLFKRAKVDIVAISIDEEEADIKKYVKENSISFKVASDLLGWEGKIVTDYAVYATPSMFIVDRNMNIVAKPITGEQLFSEVEKLIKF